MKTFAIAMLLANTQAIALNRDPTAATDTNDAVSAIGLHWNEDPNSVPTPLSGGIPMLTSTQARFVAENSTANAKSVEPKYWGPANWHFDSLPYNHDDAEYGDKVYADLGEESEDSDDDLDLGSEESDDDDDDLDLGESDEDSDDDVQNVQLGSKWHVAPDYGELEHNVVLREKDIKNGEKASGWTNPLGWTDDGADDEKVL